MLTDKKIKNLKPTEKRIRRSDGDGLYIIVEPSGRKYFVYEYKEDNKTKRKCLGDFSLELNLKNARIAVEEYKQSLLLLKNNVNYDFEFLVSNFLKYQKNILRESSLYVKSMFIKKFIIPRFKNKKIYEISRQDILDFLRDLDGLNKKTVVKNAYDYLNQIFNFCYYECSINPCSQINIKFIAKKYKVQHHPVIKSNQEILKLIQDIESDKENNIIIYYAVRFIMLTALRSSNVCCLEWSEVNLEDDFIFINAHKMKNNRDFKLPLSKQAKQVLIDIKKLQGYNDSKYVFYRLKPQIHLHTQDLTRFMQRLGYTSIMRIHSFRTLFSTICNEYRREHNIYYDVIEKCLAHYLGGVRAVYNRADNFDEMRFLMQWYADFLENLKNYEK